MRMKSSRGWPLAVLLAGCATVNDAPVDERSTPMVGRAAAPQGAEHVVVAGDTLYGVAFRHGLDYRRLAAWNGIASPYTIRPGQHLRLVAPSSSAYPERPGAGAPVSDALAPDFNGSTQTYATAEAPVSTAAPLQVEALPEDAPSRPAPMAAPASTRAAPPRAPATSSTGPVSAAIGNPADAPAPGTAPPPMPNPPPAAAPVALDPAPLAPAPGAIAKAPTQSVAGVAWRWPADGRVANRYVAGDAARQGIDILGREGQAVTAAADGEVVYSGNGLLGYGELVIIKHSGDFLSAYGHNRRRLVAEGTRVRGGQPIAEMGKGGGVERLHFEIRRDGKPVDPVAYLPRR
jgi:lipoprotein NlpD